jgi:hypothetical protein
MLLLPLGVGVPELITFVLLNYHRLFNYEQIRTSFFCLALVFSLLCNLSLVFP